MIDRYFSNYQTRLELNSIKIILPLKIMASHFHILRNDDIFINTSSETVIEKTDFEDCSLKKFANLNINCNEFLKFEEDSTFKCLADRIVGFVSPRLINIYCAFCEYNTKLESLLTDHIVQNHKLLIQELSLKKNVTFECCRFCHAKFFYKELSITHLFQHHEEIIELIFKKQTEEFFSICLFCPYKVLKRHIKLLFDHTQRKHLEEFALYLKFTYFENTIINFDISNANSELALNNKYSPYNQIEYSNVDEFNSKGINEHGSTWIEKKRNKKKQKSKIVKRLSFSNNSEIFTKKTSLSSFKSRILSIFNFKLSISNQDSTPVAFPNYLILSYRCGVCEAQFPSNNELKNHLSSLHRGPKCFYRARFGCGICKARFYKNSFLIRHCQMHHTPKQKIK